MKRTFAAVLAISMAAVWAGGCQEEQASSGDQMARLAAVENRDLQSQFQAEMKKKDDEIKKLSEREQEQLKKAQASTHAEITKRDDEIKQLNAKLQAQMKKSEEEVQSINKQLEQCENTRDKRVAKEIDKQCEETASNLMDWVAELSAEIEQLKAGQAGVKVETDK